MGPVRDGATLTALRPRGRDQLVASATALEMLTSLVDQLHEDAEQWCYNIAIWRDANPALNGVLQAWVDDTQAIMTRRVSLWHEVMERLARLSESYDSDEARNGVLDYLLTLDAVKNGRPMDGEAAAQ